MSAHDRRLSWSSSNAYGKSTRMDAAQSLVLRFRHTQVLAVGDEFRRQHTSGPRHGLLRFARLRVVDQDDVHVRMRAKRLQAGLQRLVRRLETHHDSGDRAPLPVRACLRALAQPLVMPASITCSVALCEPE
jgi:hypothetical protein